MSWVNVNLKVVWFGFVSIYMRTVSTLVQDQCGKRHFGSGHCGEFDMSVFETKALEAGFNNQAKFLSFTLSMDSQLGPVGSTSIFCRFLIHGFIDNLTNLDQNCVVVRARIS